ncbi:glycoside hydrolase family 2 protein [Filimonas effusa]|uniref:Glycoside hydrolase family 2 n=1 Tax=Filimonas effusa TaxID=2508721 RepID=A0A4Q1D4L7_9BACT|nr:glycoside hydrolase family 2 TIM barrel-domain containing protein [Filimonas effusa]RXK83390.1 glycoside hydrolase family 2 [Filimonas effusa]
MSRKINRIGIACCFWLIGVLPAAKSQDAEDRQLLHSGDAGRQHWMLDGKWQVAVDWYDKGGADEIIRNKQPAGKADFVEYSFDNSETLQVPGDWNSQRPELKYYEGSIWYRRRFDCGVKPGKRYLLDFGGVSNRCDVFVNGEKVGSHEGGFTSFRFDITAMLRSGENLLLLKVNNERRVDAIPARKFDWWNYGGITRSVTITEVPDVHISDYFIQLKKGSRSQLGGWVQLSARDSKRAVTLEIGEAGIRKTVYTDTLGRASIDIAAALTLWSPENPRLYRVRISTEQDCLQDEIGFRSIEVSGTQILLNGKPVFLKGVSFHEEIAQRQGRAFSESDARQLLSSARELGCNFVRLAHYPQSEQTVRMAERMGLMMWEEIPVWQGIQFTNPVILQRASTMLHEMIDRDKNRCGIIIWSLSNETAPSAARNAVLTRMAAEARQADPTRLISSAFDAFKYNKNEILIKDSFSLQLDVLAANKYMGWYHPWPAGPGNVVWKSDFNKPLIISEFGGEALYGNHGSADTASLWTEEYQERLYIDNIAMFDKIPFLAGVCPWVLADFRSPFRMHASFQEGWNRKGLLSDRGFKKKAWFIMYHYYKSMDEKIKPPNNILQLPDKQ